MITVLPPDTAANIGLHVHIILDPKNRVQLSQSSLKLTQIPSAKPLTPQLYSRTFIGL